MDLEHLQLLEEVTGGLGLAITPRQGRKAKHSWGFQRELGLDDREELENPTPVERDTAPLAQIKYKHHNMARLLAEGRSAADVSRIVGISQNRLCLLQKDPAFQELVSYYTSEKHEKFLDVQERLANYSLDAIEEMQERLDEGKLNNSELLKSLELTLDRGLAPSKGVGKPGTGGPVSGGVQVLLNFNTGQAPQAAEMPRIAVRELESSPGNAGTGDRVYTPTFTIDRGDSE